MENVGVQQERRIPATSSARPYLLLSDSKVRGRHPQATAHHRQKQDRNQGPQIRTFEACALQDAPCRELSYSNGGTCGVYAAEWRACRVQRLGNMQPSTVRQPAAAEMGGKQRNPPLSL